MSMMARPDRQAPARERTAAEDAAIKAAAAWINQLARTLKTCRLYDGNNPTVVRFREDLAQGLTRLLDELGAVTFRFQSDDVLYDDASLYPARSRDDNLALVFFRDGIHAISFTPGIGQDEVEGLLDALLQVGGQNAGDDDLVTLLWERHLDHVDVEYVPTEGDVGNADAGDGTTLVPWPTGHEDAATAEAGPPPADGTSRADDWTTGDLTVEIEATYEELNALSGIEVERFRAEFERERATPLVTATLAISGAFLGAGITAADRADLARFLPRVLRQATAAGAWAEARQALALLRRCDSADWTIETFAQELLQPISVTAAVEKVDQQEPPEVEAFVGFARELGDPAVDWLNLVLADSQQRRTRRVLAEAIADLCRDTPERLAPWLSDPRWYVVRNIVHILGWIGGDGIIGLLDTALRHPEPQVRQEVVAALGQMESKLARPMLLRLIDGADTRTFCSVLHQLSAGRDATTARLLLAHMLDPAFELRPVEEKRAIYSAVSATGGDEIVPELEAELHKGNWFSRAQESHRQAVARCLARVGTPLARMVLDEGAKSKRGPVRKACEDALGSKGEERA